MYQDSGVCNQRSNEAGVIFSGCLNFAHDKHYCADWVAFMNCAKDSFNEKACENGDKTPTGFGSEGNGSVAPWAHDKLRKSGSNTTSNEAIEPAYGDYISNVFSKGKNLQGNCLRTDYSDMLMTKNHPRTVQQYCNNTNHITVLDQETEITRFNDVECGGSRNS